MTSTGTMSYFAARGNTSRAFSVASRPRPRHSPVAALDERRRAPKPAVRRDEAKSCIGCIDARAVDKAGAWRRGTRVGRTDGTDSAASRETRRNRGRQHVASFAGRALLHRCLDDLLSGDVGRRDLSGILRLLVDAPTASRDDDRAASLEPSDRLDFRAALGLARESRCGQPRSLADFGHDKAIADLETEVPAP